MSKRGDSKGKKGGPVEEELEPVAPPPEPEPLDPYAQLSGLWQLDPIEAREQVGQLFEMVDGPDHSMESMLLDEMYGHLHFANEAGMNGSQTKIFMGIVDEVKRRCSDNEPLAETFTWFKDKILSNSVLRTTMEEVIAEEERIKTASRPVTVAPAEEGEVKGKKAPPKGKKGAKEEPPPEPEPEPEPEKPRENQLFIPEMITGMCTHMSTGVFAHYNLYRSVFNSNVFKPRTRLVLQPVRVDTVVPDVFSLKDAVNLDEIREQEEAEQREREEQERLALEEKKEKGLARMVARSLAAAREQMRQTLADNEKELTERLALAT